MGPGQDRADVRAGDGDWLCCEIKDRASLPRWLLAGLGQARRYALGEQLPLLVLHEKGARTGDSLVVMRLSDFTAWFGGLPGDSGQVADTEAEV